MIKVGLLGAGRIAGVHATAISRNRDSDLVAVSDVVGAAADALAAHLGCAVRTSEEIIADPAIDAILIATSTDTHADYIEAAVTAGKAVLCEKPVDLSLERARECLNAVDASGQPVMIGLNRRFDRSFAALQAALAAGEIGAPELLSITSFDPAPPPLAYIKVSGGLFRDMMIHDFDMSHFLMGAVPDTITATASSLVDPEIGAAGDVDTAAVTMHYADGRIGVIKNSRRAAFGYDQRVEVLGSKGHLQVQNVAENTMVKSTEAGVTAAKPVHFFLERYMDAYAAEWDAFVTAVQNGAPMPVTLEDGVTALAMAEAAARSQNEKRPVKLVEVL
ncbi:MAG: inositol 2-dehydrogenase [Pseudomonadota bacterium]